MDDVPLGVADEEIDWSGWKAVPNWPLGVACALILGLQPYAQDTLDNARYTRLYAAARAAIRRGKLKGIELTEEEAEKILPWVGDYFEVGQQDFLQWAQEEGYWIPPELERQAKRKQLPTTSSRVRRTRDQDAREAVQGTAKELFSKHPDWRVRDAVHEIKGRELHQRKNGTFVMDGTVHRWVSEVAPNHAKRPGAPPGPRKSSG